VLLLNIIHEIATKISKEIAENIELVLLEGNNISEFILKTKKMLDEIGVTITGKALETVDVLVKNDKERKRDWNVKDKKSQKSLATIFGEVKYERTYYVNKRTGEYKYLSDEAVGIETNDRMDILLESMLIEEAIESPYRKSGEKISKNVTLTGQTVMNSIRKLQAVPNNAAPIKGINPNTKILFIEADEDHVSLQRGKCVEPRLIYVHEGKRKVSQDRYELINPRYFSGIYKESADLWLEVADYIDQNYIEENVEKIYLSGDGAYWIKEGKEWIKDSIYVLDRFHLSKYIKKATAHIKGSHQMMWHYINTKRKDFVKELFKVLIEGAETESKLESIKDARSYILNNWQGIMNQYNPDYIGCSAEGHISHVLSARLSSRPLSWCREGVDQMSRLRAFKANSGKVYDLVKEKKKASQNATNMISAETFGNIPMMQNSKNTNLRNIFKRILSA